MSPIQNSNRIFLSALAAALVAFPALHAAFGQCPGAVGGCGCGESCRKSDQPSCCPEEAEQAGAESATRPCCCVSGCPGLATVQAARLSPEPESCASDSAVGTDLRPIDHRPHSDRLSGIGKVSDTSHNRRQASLGVWLN